MAGTRDTLGVLSYCPARAGAQDLGAGNFGGKGGDALREAPPTHPTPPRPGGWEARSVPGARAWPRRVPGCAPRAAGLEGLRRDSYPGRPLDSREPASPGLHAGLSQGAPVWPLLAAALGPGPGVWKPQCEPGACAHPKAWGDACPLQFCRPPRGESQLLAPGASLGTRLDLGPSPHFSGELVKAIVGDRASLPTRVLSIVCHVFIPAWEGRLER
uniref:Uncharacterized protein n=1 Tax=Mus musculus TaxID=10090 RepID=Q8CD34_MOUSE|nr:unnamed protein product [Mus musculus]